MGITVLGPLIVNGSGRLGPRDRVVLEALACRPGRPVSAAELSDALWADHPPASAAKNLQSCVVRLRKALGADAIVTTEHGYQLALPADQVDARAFEAEVVRTRELFAVGSWDRAAFALDRALQTWRGPPFVNLPEWEPARQEAARLEELRLEAEELLVDARLRVGRPREVVAAAQAMVHAAPLRERRWCLLATAQYAAGSQGEALETLRQLRHVLDEQLGVDPGTEAQELERGILRQEAALRGVAPSDASGDCPWLGLRSYDVEDADQFFGREADVATCLDLLARTSLLVVVGPSGSGKSSIVRAGVLAALGRRGHALVVVTPGRHPLRSLAVLEDGAPTTTVLAVDQAEEVFTLCDDPAERQAFWDAVVHAADLRPVVVALRADRLGDVAEHPRLRLRVERGLQLVGPLDPAGLRQVVLGPARQAGLHVEPGLVDLLVRDVGDDPGALPLLSHALVETWHRREGATLTVDGYLASGGIHGAVARSAERLYADVGPERRELLRDVVLRLISPGPAGEPVRTRVPRRQLATDRARSELVERLVAARLVTSDDGVLEITHEALARAWPRLRGWLDDDLEGQRILHHLSGSAESWDVLGRPASELYRGVRLARALEWRARTRSTLTSVEEQFLSAATAAAEDDAAAAARTARAQALLIRRLRLVLTGAVLLLLLALASGGLAVLQSQRAGSNAQVALDAERRALARRAAALALVTEDAGESLQLALAGAGLDESPDTRTGLLGALARRPRLYSSVPVADGAVPRYLEMSADGRYVALLDEENVVRLHDAATGDLVAERPVGPAVTRFGHLVGRLLAFSPDGRFLAVTAAPEVTRPVRLLTVPGLEPGPRLGRLPARGWQAADLVFSSSRDRLAAVIRRFGHSDGLPVPVQARALVWDLERPDDPRTFPMSGRDGFAVALDRRGTSLYTSHPLRRHDLRTGRTRGVFRRDDSHYLWGMHVLDGGRQILALDGGEPVLFSARTGEVVVRFPGGSFNDALRVAPDEGSFARIGFALREVSWWSFSRPRQPSASFTLDRGNPNTVTFAPDGTSLVAFGQGDPSLRRWDLSGDRQFLRRLPSSAPAGGGFGVMAPGGRYSVVLTGEGWDVTDHRTGRTSRIHASRGYRHTYGAFHPTRPVFATAIGSTVRLWDIRTGARLGRPRSSPDGAWITELDWTPDARRLAVATISGRVSLLDGTTLEPVTASVDVGRPLSWVVARPDGHTAVVLTGSVEPTGSLTPPGSGWALVDLRHGRVVRRGELGMRFPYWLAVSPDGRTAAVAGGNDADATGNAGATGSIQLIDLTSGDLLGPSREWEGGSRAQVAFSPDGARFLTTSGGGLAALWDLSTASPLARVQVPGATAVAGAFMPDGRDARLLDWGTGEVVVWELDFDVAVQFACRAAGRDLTAEEWREHFGDEPYRESC